MICRKDALYIDTRIKPSRAPLSAFPDAGEGACVEQQLFN